MQAPKTHLNHRLISWTKSNLFGSPASFIVTVLILYGAYKVIPALFSWAILESSFLGETKSDCLQNSGACWVFIKVRLGMFMYGFYPLAERWRIDFSLLYLFATAIPLLLFYISSRKRLLALYSVSTALIASVAFYTANNAIGHSVTLSVLLFAAVLLPVGLSLLFVNISAIKIHIFALFLITFPVIIWLFLGGGILVPVSTDMWGGFFLTLIVAISGLIGSLPIGILLALGRQSKLVIVKVISTTFIEFIRGVPLISILFMASIMLPLFLPEGVSVNKLLRALIGVAIFYAAYMAEVVRGGLQGISKGQYEAADALGLNYWQKQRLVILPQALRIVIPGIINTVLGLFKDTTLVAVIGLFDLLGTVKTALADTEWLGFSKEAYLFAALVFWVICYLISRYGRLLERHVQIKSN